MLAALDNAPCVAAIAQLQPPSTVARGLVLFELAAQDGGMAALCFSRFLGQMPIAEFGTEEQKARYASGKNLLHGALCLTEPIPGAGAEALLLMGTYRPAGGVESPLIEIDKRGRFTSQMEFAEFVVAAVQGVDGARGSALVLLEPGDAGSFDRGTPVRKVGQRIASTTHPAFRLRIPASRIVGGFTIEDGVLRPRFDHRQLLEPALRRARTLLALTTAAKALAVTRESLPHRADIGAAFWLACADLWAAGEAAASLGFLSARLCDAHEERGAGNSLDAAEINLFTSAAKLFASTRIAPGLARVAAEAGAGADNFLRHAADAQVEAVSMGPEATQRRALSAAFGEASFDAKSAGWIDEMESCATGFCAPAARNLAAGFRLWWRTLCVLRDAAGADSIFHGAHQAAAFALADALSGLLAARSLLLDAAELDAAAREREAGIVVDLVRLAAASAVSRATQSCTGLSYGLRDSSLVARSHRELAALRAEACASLSGFQYARERIARFLESGEDAAE